MNLISDDDVTAAKFVVYVPISEIFGGDLGIAYLGTQGDVWDAHKDMGLASLGALIAMLVTIGINSYLQKMASLQV